jgi:hypothetical protein
MKYYIDIRFKDGTSGYYEYDELYETNWCLELYKVEGLIFKKRIFIDKIPKARVAKYTTGKRK